ncbi:hypothetical protein BJ138DRAFT_1105792 [Hygrophoropsis aurantiaca]|uniref:Uncharacterized protein n=1 Tax=Hygrophoropsis aurantiaca TaxID=72124 RepID=A0ACB7ZXA2_9AGAM|nr:hypothetical protein BJ138DRAFT_1105792 [Hygrophoropsis aurantiaca]
MAITTRAKNANQHPGKFLLRDKQVRRTMVQKAEDDQREHEALEQKAAARQAGLARIAAIEDRLAAEELFDSANPPKPKPRPRRLPQKATEAAAAQTVKTNAANGAGSIGSVPLTKDMEGIRAKLDVDSGDHDDGVEVAGKGRKCRVQHVLR